MATSVAAAFNTSDLTHQQFLRPHQSIFPLRRERTSIDGEFRRSRELQPVYSQELPKKSSAFSGEKQYERRQLSTQVRSAKSHEIFRLIDRRLQTGIHGVHLMFRANDPHREGKLSKQAFRRVLMQLCGFINAEEWDKVCKMFHIHERDGTITFEEFLSYFPDNEKAKRELVQCQTDIQTSELLSLNRNTTFLQSQHRRHLPKLTATYCFILMKAKCHEPSFVPADYLPYDCLNDGAIGREHLKTILGNFHLEDILQDENEFEKLWTKFDLDNVGFVRTNIFLRLLDYRVNLADEINADIQRLVSRSTAATMIDRQAITAKKQRRPSCVRIREQKNELDDHHEQHRHDPPPTAVGDRLEVSTPPSTESKDHQDTSKTLPPPELPTRELSTKFRTLVHQHRKMIKQLHDTDELIPFLDRKVNEGYFCLKTVFAYLDPDQIGLISKEQFVAALNQFEIGITIDLVDRFFQKHHSTAIRNENNENRIDYNMFLKYFQDRSDSSFLARTLRTFSHQKSNMNNNSEFSRIENGIIDLLHRIFLSLTAAFKFISNDNDDLCSERDLFLILKKELGIDDSYRFPDKQKDEIYQALNCNHLRQKKQLPYKRFLYFLGQSTGANKEQFTFPNEKRDGNDQLFSAAPPRKLAYMEKVLNDLIRLRMHTFTKVFSRIDQPRTDMINKEQFFDVLQEMGINLTRTEVEMIWLSSGFHAQKSIPFPNLIRQLIIFNRDENQTMINKYRVLSSTATPAVSSRDLSSSQTISSMHSQSMNYREIFDRIHPYIHSNYNAIKNELIDKDYNACGLIDFAIMLDILHHHGVPINDVELGILVRLDNPHNGSKIQYPFFLRKYHPNGPIMKTSPWFRVHPIYEQLIQKQHAKYSMKDVYDQRLQNPRDLKYFIRLFISYDKGRKGYLNNEEFHSLLRDNGMHLNSSDEDYYQLFSIYDKQLRDQFNYTDLFRAMINAIMS